jgi:hypothetical protein
MCCGDFAQGNSLTLNCRLLASAAVFEETQKIRAKPRGRAGRINHFITDNPDDALKGKTRHSVPQHVEPTSARNERVFMVN